MNSRILAIAALAVGLTACGSMGSTYRDGHSNQGSYRNDYRSDQGSYRNDYRCQNCGVVQHIQSHYSDGRTSGGGAIAGAVIGGVIGNQIGSGDGRRAATVVGAVAGGFAGNAIERDANDVEFSLDVRMDSGQRINIRQRQLKGVREGSRVQVSNGSARLL